MKNVGIIRSPVRAIVLPDQRTERTHLMHSVPLQRADHSVEAPDRHGFKIEIKLELVTEALTHPDLLKPHQIRKAFEMKAPLDNLLGTVHLALLFPNLRQLDRLSDLEVEWRRTSDSASSR